MLDEKQYYDPLSWTRIFSFHWYKDQMTGWTPASYTLLIVGMILQLVLGFSKGFSWLGLTSTLAGMIGFTCVIAITNAKPINGLLGLVNALLLMYVALKTGNYSDIIMQISYVCFLDIPVLMLWKTKVEPRTLNSKYFLQTVGCFIVFWAATWVLDTQIVHSPQAFLDSLAAAIGLTGSVLASRKFRAQYYFWVAQGAMSVALWVQTAFNGHPVWSLMITYVLYLCNDLLAFVDKKVPWFHAKEHKTNA